MPSSVAELTVIVPVRNAERLIDGCLSSVVDQGAARVIVVDGESTDSTRERASRYPVELLSDRGTGVAAARLLGAKEASTPWIAFVDVDVVLPAGALAALIEEAEQEGLVAVQAQLASVAGPGYWGQALAHHHRSGRSKNWFGLVATAFRRQAFLDFGLDVTFLSGEDIDIRWRLENAGARAGVSTRTTVEHRFDDTLGFALDQFEADGAGLARMAVKHGWGAMPLLALPLAAGLRGIALSVIRRELQWIPYYITFVALNSYAMARQLYAAARFRGRH